MQTGRVFAVLVPAVVLSGCLQSTTLVKVNADGSGTVETQALMTTAALAQVRQLAGAFGGTDAKPFDPFSEQQMRDLASQMGEGVALVSTRPLQSPSAEGREAIYSFRDVSKLRLTQAPAAPGGPSARAGAIGAGGQSDAMTLAMSKTAAGNALLTLHLGGNPLAGLADRTGAGDAQNGLPLPADQIALMQPMLAGMRVTLSVEPAGRLVKTSSPYVEGNTVTLFDIEMDALLNDAAFKQLQTAKTSQEAKDALKSIKGVKLVLDPEITIEFAP